MLSNRLKDNLRRDEVVLGTWTTIQDALATQILGRCGFDFLTIDMEHGPVTLQALQQTALAAATTSALPIVRTAWNDSCSIQVSLDAGVAGAIVPYVNDLATAQRVVHDARYPPMGKRSVGGLRSPFAFNVDDIGTYQAEANDNVLLFIMCETKEAAEIAGEVAALAGVDGLFVGPRDLSLSLGLSYPRAWDEACAPLHDAVAAIAHAARNAGKNAGILARDIEMARKCIELGYRFVAVGDDALFLQQGARAILSALR
jgi:4-hydroxy-2-oxoheptanedioate aldolase